MSGFVIMHRDALEHPVLKDGDRFRAWFWLVANACWKPTRVRIKGTTMLLDRGEMTFSVRFLADQWGWSKSRVDRFIADLREEGMISTRSKIGTAAGQNAGQGQSIITICNYAKYQDSGSHDRDIDLEENGTTAGQQRDKEEQGNKGTIEEEPIGSSPPIPPQPAKSATKPKKVPMPPDWQPQPLPADVAELVAQWPPGRLKIELAEFREYWIDDGERRPGWDRTWRSRIRTIHDRVMREHRNGRHGQTDRGSASGDRGARDTRDGFQRHLDDQIFGPGRDSARPAASPPERYAAGEARGDRQLPIAGGDVVL